MARTWLCATRAATAARALAERGEHVTILERAGQLAAGASGTERAVLYTKLPTKLPFVPVRSTTMPVDPTSAPAMPAGSPRASAASASDAGTPTAAEHLRSTYHGAAHLRTHVYSPRAAPFEDAVGRWAASLDVASLMVDSAASVNHVYSCGWLGLPLLHGALA